MRFYRMTTWRIRDMAKDTDDKEHSKYTLFCVCLLSKELRYHFFSFCCPRPRISCSIISQICNILKRMKASTFSLIASTVNKGFVLSKLIDSWLDPVLIYTLFCKSQVFEISKERFFMKNVEFFARLTLMAYDSN